MAPGLSRWASVALIGCAAIAAVYLPPPEREVDESVDRFSWEAVHWTPERRIENRLKSALRHLENELQIATDSEAFVKQLASRGRGHGPTLFFAEPVPPGEQRTAQTFFDSLTQSLQLTSPEVDLIVRVTLDPDQQPRTIRRLRVSTDRLGCDVQLSLGWAISYVERVGGKDIQRVDRGRWVNRFRNGLVESLGPCAYYTAFGRPGTHIEDWLRSRRPRWNPRGDRLQYWFAHGVSWESESRLLDWESANLWNRPLPVRGCAEGSLAHCRGVVFDSLAPSDWSDQWYLSDLVHAMGRDRFARFWRSPLPVDAAFQEAFGLPIERWTRNWLLRRRGGRAVPRAGFTVLSTLTTLLLAIAALGGATLYAAKRQVG
ncbi:MAG: hypothetical protein HY700_01245 [Gemmatimonadetes bacterium]|nr:hypothetical protein [Gemmatimonadota bacterium]